MPHVTPERVLPERVPPERLTPERLSPELAPVRRLHSQRALVTGASRGIGRAVALALGRAGAEVIVHFRTQEAAAHDVAAAIRADGGEATVLQADLADPDGPARLAAAAGPLHILINNAGQSLTGLFHETPPGAWDELMRVNLHAPMRLCQAVLPAMISRGYGRIVNISSIWGLTGGALEVAYATAKAGLIGLTRALAREAAPWGIAVNAIAPGVIDTDMLSQYSDDERADLAFRTPVGRLGKPEDVAQVVLFLVDPASGFTTGQVISPSGGMV